MIEPPDSHDIQQQKVRTNPRHIKQFRLKNSRDGAKLPRHFTRDEGSNESPELKKSIIPFSAVERGMSDIRPHNRLPDSIARGFTTSS